MTIHLLPIFLLGVLMVGCATPHKPPSPSEPQPKSIQIRGNASVNAEPNQEGLTVTKELFEIIMDNKNLWVNKVPVKDLKALSKLLKKYKTPVMTISTHKCLTREKSLALMAIAQENTETPIAYRSYGDYDDAHCQQSSSTK
jgi:hypothetical protein